MERKFKIIKNAIQCKICGEILESTSVHNFVPCKCYIESNGAKGCFCDGGLEYLRWGGNPDEYINLSETRLYTDEERDEYNKNIDEIYKKYGMQGRYMD